MGVEIDVSRFYTIAETYEYILLGEEHFFAPHQRFARKVTDEFDENICVEVIPSSFSKRTKAEQLDFLKTLDQSAPFTSSGAYQSLMHRIVGLKCCPDSEKAPTLTDEYDMIRNHWYYDDEGYSRMLATQIKSSGTKLHLVGNFRITKISEYLPNSLSIPQIFKDDKQISEMFIIAGKLYSQISF